MLNSVAAGRRLALRAAAWQTLGVLLVAAAFLLARGTPHAAAALFGGLAVAVGGLAAARVALGGGVGSAGTAMVRLLSGMALKWAVVFTALVLGLAVWKMPPLALIAGLLAGLAMQALTSVWRR